MQATARAGGAERAPDHDLAPFALKEPPITVGKALLELPLLLLFAALIAIVVKAFVAQLFFIPSASMEPQLTAGDRVAVSRTAYRLHEPNRGDVVVFHDPTERAFVDDRFLPIRIGGEALEALGVIRPDRTELIKRIIGLPGETVMAEGSRIYIDGVLLDEPYIVEGEFTNDFDPEVIPPGHYWMMGDNRDNSADSREFGAVPEDLIVGRAIAVVWPPLRASNL